jgi:hypothetical protein
MQNLHGKGKLYDTGENLIGEVHYDISLKSPGAEWWGEIIPGNGIMPVGSYIIELEDGRRGPCNTKIRTNSSFGLVVDSFDIEGAGPLSR